MASPAFFPSEVRASKRRHNRTLAAIDAGLLIPMIIGGAVKAVRHRDEWSMGQLAREEMFELEADVALGLYYGAALSLVINAAGRKFRQRRRRIEPPAAHPMPPAGDVATPIVDNGPLSHRTPEEGSS